MAYRLKRPDGGRLGDKAGHWKGGRVVLGAGYIALYKPEHPYANNRGYVMEHRLVMEEHIGRLLTPREIVHHIDGDKKNNAIENLELTKTGRHIHDHFQNSHETIELRKQVAELEAQLLKYKERYGDIE